MHACIYTHIFYLYSAYSIYATIDIETLNQNTQTFKYAYVIIQKNLIEKAQVIGDITPMTLYIYIF